MAEVTPKEGKETAVTIELTADADLVRPGMTGNLIDEKGQGNQPNLH